MCKCIGPDSYILLGAPNSLNAHCFKAALPKMNVLMLQIRVLLTGVNVHMAEMLYKQLVDMYSAETLNTLTLEPPAGTFYPRT